MSLVKYSNHTPSHYNRFYNDDLFDEIFNWNNRQVSKQRNTSPSVNIKENEDGFTLELATPGLNKKDLSIELNNDILTIASKQKEEKNETKENYSLREFHHQSFERSFTLPDSVNSDGIKAKYEDGILSVFIPKKEEAKPKPKMEIAIA